VTGTQTGPFMQMQATGKPFDIEGIDIVTVDDDLKVTEHWGILDLAKMMQQVGAVPPPPM
jgi:predicted ester cyclase